MQAKATNVRVVFRNFDADKSGTLDIAEFRRGLAFLGILLSDQEFANLLTVVDNDNSGTIDIVEINALMDGLMDVRMRVCARRQCDKCGCCLR